MAMSCVQLFFLTNFGDSPFFKHASRFYLFDAQPNIFIY